MPLDPDFVADAPYSPEGLLFDEILEINAEDDVVRVLMPTHDALPLTATQRHHPVKHPRHVAGGLMVHMTGMAAIVHAFYVLGLRHSEGWVGYGVRIHHARFLKLAPPGEPVEITCRALKTRRLGARVMVRYGFEFTQGTDRVYESEQTALFYKPEEVGDSPVLG